ncbi:MAG: hypothetical protein EP343_30780 [Deltaproteobacteria bacterium]|nr:MAG: hypothetical protein EP343_30780 [Deltaproteobacteria bacterium]
MRVSSLAFLLTTCAWLVLGGTPSYAKKRSLQPGDKVQTTSNGTESFLVSIQEAGEYRLETHGESDTRCELRSPRRGEIASDDNQGVAKNCRMDLWLAPGSYLWTVKKDKRPVKVSVARFEPQGSSTRLSLGKPHVDELTAMRVRTFHVRVNRRRWLDIDIYGVTVQTCRLLNNEGWVVPVGRSQTTAGITKQGYLQSCKLFGLLEPGTYSIKVVGRPSQTTGKTQSVNNGSLLLYVGDKAVRPFRWSRVSLKPYNKRSYWFTVPSSWGNPSTGKVKVLLQLSATTPVKSNWYTLLQQQDWYSSRKTTVRGCYRGAKHSTPKQCDIIADIDAGKRYTVQVSGAYGQKFWMRYILVYSQSKLPIGRRIKLLDQPDIGTYANFSITQPGRYHVETWPHTRSCLLEKEQRPNRWKLLQVKSLALPMPQAPDSMAAPSDDRRQVRWTALLEQGGTSQWIHLKTESTLIFGSKGRLDTKCTLYRNEYAVARHDDLTKKNRNCHIERRLQPGLYRINVRAYGKRGNSRVYVMYQGDKQNTAVPVTGGCNVSKFLTPGRYRIRASASGALRLREMYVTTLPLQTGQALRLTTLHRTLKDVPKKTVTLPLHVKTKTLWTSISNVSACRLLKNKAEVRRGKMKGRTCRLYGSIKAGTYQLELTQVPRLRHKFRRLSGASHPIWIRSSSKVKWNRNNINRLPRPEKNVYKKLALKVSQGNSHSLSMTLGESQAAHVRWTIKQRGMYQFQTTGLVPVQCQLNDARGRLHETPAPTLQKRNCQWAGLLQPGDYTLEVLATSNSKGRVHLQLSRLKTQTLRQLQDKQPTTEKLQPNLAQVHPFQVTQTNKHHIQTHSIDTPVSCAVVNKEGWTWYTLSSCNGSLDLPINSYTFWMIPTETPARYRVTFNSGKKPQELGPSLSYRIARDIKSKPAEVQLQRKVTLRYRAPQPSDKLTFKIPTSMKVEFNLSTNLIGRLFRGDQFVAKWLHTKASPSKQAISLKAGTYNLMVQGQNSSLQSYTNYSVETNVLETQPGVRLWRKVPSTLKLSMAQAGSVSIATEGDLDTWCRLVRQDGSTLASNDDATSKRWDCRIDRWLPAGKYRVVVDGTPGRAWLSVKKVQPKHHQLALNAKQRHNLVPFQRNVFAMKLKKATVLQLSTALTSNGSPLHCLLEDTGQKSKVYESQGDGCSPTFALQQGSYQWHVYHTGESTQEVSLQSTTPSVVSLASGKQQKLSLDADKAVYLSASLKTWSRYRWKLSGKDLTKLSCAANQGQGTNLKPFNCQDSLLRGEQTVLFALTSSKKQTLALQLQAESLEVGDTYNLGLKSKQSVQLGVTVPQAGLYQLATKSDASWSLQVQEAMGIPTGTKRQQPSLLVYLSKGDQAVTVTSNVKEMSSGTVTLTPVSTAKESVSKTLGLHQGTLAAKTSAQWKLPKNKAFQVTVTLHGKGSVVALNGDNEVLQRCATRETQTCSWYLNDSDSGIQLWWTASSKLQYQAQVATAAYVNTTVKLKPGSQWTFPQSVQGTSLWTLLLEGNGSTGLALVGEKAQCILPNQPSQWQSCETKLTLNDGARVMMKATSLPARVVAFAQGKKMEALWSLPTPTAKTQAFPLSFYQRTMLQTSKASTVWYTFTLNKAEALELRTTGGSTRCALIAKKSGKVVDVSAGTSGCHLSRGLAAGTYWVGVHAENQLHNGSIQLNNSPLHTLKEGRKGPMLLGSGQSLWFVFNTKHNKKMGVGAIGRHDDLQCTLWTAHGKPVTSGCQRYLKLKPGTYMYRVSLPKDASPTPVRVILRGQKPPPNQPPAAYLRKLLKRASL